MNYADLVTTIQDYAENDFDYTANPSIINTFIRQAEQRIYNTVQISNLRKNVTGTISSGNKYLQCPADFLSVYSLAIYPQGGGDYAYLLNKDVNFIREAYPGPSDTGAPRHYAIFGPRSDDVNELTFLVGPTPDIAYSAELHYYYYPDSIVQSVINTLGVLVGGTSYTNGTYFNVPLTGGIGTGATANIIISGGAVSSVTIVNGGCYYAVGNVLSASSANLGGTGSGFTTTINVVTNSTGRTWLGDNFDSALFNATMMEALTYMKVLPEDRALYEDRYAQSIALLKNLGDGKQRMDAYRDGQVRLQVN
jgi:hypothetical protein